jgi:hypothetical protein
MVTWYPWPKMGVAELKPPENGKAYWDFALMDEYTEDFTKATEGRPVVIDYSTIPEWMFKTKAPAAYPEDPEQITWDYEQGTELRDPTISRRGRVLPATLIIASRKLATIVIAQP